MNEVKETKSQPKRGPSARTLLRIFLSMALLGSVWAAFGSAGCGSCAGAQAMAQGKGIAYLGVLFYSLLAFAALFGPRGNFISTAGSLLAGGIHVGLLVVLFNAGIFCAPCLLTGVAAISAAFVSFSLDEKNYVRAWHVVPASAFLIQLYFLMAGAFPDVQRTREDATRVAAEVMSAPPVKDDRVRMLIYFRDDCGHCQELKRDVMPHIEKEFKNVLDVKWRSAENLNIKTPTIFVTGRAGTIPMTGLHPTHPVDHLRSAIRKVMGARVSHALLQNSR